MGAKVVTLLLGPDQVSRIEAKYPGCVLSTPADTEHRLQEYRVMVPGWRNDHGLYDLLLDTMLSVSSAQLQPNRLPRGKLLSSRFWPRTGIWLFKIQNVNKLPPFTGRKDSECKI